MTVLLTDGAVQSAAVATVLAALVVLVKAARAAGMVAISAAATSARTTWRTGLVGRAGPLGAEEAVGQGRAEALERTPGRRGERQREPQVVDPAGREGTQPGHGQHRLDHRPGAH